MSLALPYDILFCTSEDPQHPVSQLGGSSGEVKPGAPPPLGWQSVRHCKTPQTIVLRFHGTVWLQQLRILSHEAKIASKVDVRVATLTEEDDWHNPPSFRNVRFTKLGSVDFKSNEQSHFKSKERKTVHLKTEAYFLKLLFDKPFINAFNSGHQIGIYSLECSGYVKEPILVHADQPLFSRAPSRRGSQWTPTRRSTTEEGPSTSTPAPVVPTGTGVKTATAGNVGAVTGRRCSLLASSTPVVAAPLTSHTNNKAQSRTAPAGAAFRSIRIIEFEDFFVRRSEELVSLKAEAVALEDFQVAVECRDKLALLNKYAKEIYELEQDKVQAIIDEQFEVAQEVKERMNRLVAQLFEQTTLPLPPSLRTSPTKDVERESQTSNGADASCTPDTPLSHHIKSFSPDPPTPSRASSFIQEAADVDSLKSPVIEANEEAVQELDAKKVAPHERAVASAILSWAGTEEEATVAYTNPSFDVGALMAAVGSFAVACLVSKRFRLREAALMVLTEQVHIFPSPAPAVEGAVLRFLDLNAYGLQDSIPNVVCAACAFIRMCLADSQKCIGTVVSPLVSLLPRLITRCGDSLQRIREEVTTTLSLYVSTPAVPPGAVLSVALMEPMDKERRNLPITNSRAQLSRLTLLKLLTQRGRLPFDGNAATSAQVLEKLLLPTVNHPHREVRDMAASILAKLVSEHQLIMRDKDLSKITKVSIRESIASKR